MPVATANGKRFTFPDGTTPDQMGQAIDEYFSQQTEPAITETAQVDQVDVQQERPQITGGRGIAGQREQQKQFDYKEAIKSQIPAYQGDVGQLQELGAAPEFNEPSMQSLKASLAANLMGSDFELAQALQDQIPGTTFSRDEDANLIAQFPSGGSYYLNAPGLSGQDLAKFGTRAAAFAVPGGGSLPALAVKAGLTETVLQGTEAGLGGEFNKEDIGLATVAAPVGQAVVGGIGKALTKASAQRALNEAAPSIDLLKGRARDIYQKIDDLGVTVKQQPLQKMSSDIASTMKREGFNARIHPKVAAAMDEISTQTGQPLKISEIDTLRRVARSAARSIEPDEARLGSIMVQKIDDFLDSSPQVLGGDAAKVGKMFREARGYWSKAKKSEMLNDAVEKAKNQASGFENGIRVQFRSLLNNKKAMRGFSEAEKDALRKVVRGGTAENVAKALGKFGFSEGQATSMLLGSLGVAGGAAIGGGPGAVAVPLVGQMSKNLAQRLTRSNARFADQVIRAGSDAKKIAEAYIRNTPKSQRSTAELTELLMRDGVKLGDLAKSSNKLFADSAYFADAIRSGATTESSRMVAEEVQGGVDDLLNQQQ